MRSRFGPALLLLALSVTTLAACDDDDTGASKTAMVRIVNASSGTPGSITAVSGTTSLGTALNFGTAAGTCVAVPITNGGNTFTITSNGTNVATTTQTLAEGGDYTLIVAGTGVTATPIFLDNEVATPASGSVAVRFVNATGTAGQVYATPASATSLANFNAMTGATNVAAGGTTSFLTTASTNTRFWLASLNSSSNVYANTGTNALTFPSSGGTTIVFLPQANSTGAQFIQLNPCG